LAGFVVALRNLPTMKIHTIRGRKLAWALILWLALSPWLALAQDKSLLEAAKTGDVGAIKALVAAKADLNQTDPNGRTALMLAAMGGHLNVVSVLLDAGADVSARDGSGATAQDLARKTQNEEIGQAIADFAKRSDPDAAFKDALAKGNLDGIKRALESGADVNLRLREGATPLMLAASTDPRRGLPLLKLLLDKGASVNATDDSDESAIDRAEVALQEDAEAVVALLKSKGAIPDRGAKRLNESLRQAVEQKDVDMVRALLGKKADPNHVGQYKSTTVLMLAAEAGQQDIVEALLESGANPNVKTTIGDRDDNLGKTALFFAVQGGHAEVARILIGKKATVDARLRGGATPLMFAVWGPKQFEAAKLLLAAGANPNAKAKDGDTALLVAAGYRNDYQTVKLLLDAGADITATTKENGDVLGLASASGDAETAKLLLAKSFAQGSKDIALRRAADGGRLEVAKVFLQNGADPNAKSSDGRTAIQLAAARGHEALIRLLA
jgi:ankyrin repeat protein